MLTDQWLQQLPLPSIDRVVPVGGGDINETYAVVSGGRRYFLKVHQHIPGNFFVLEAAGLDLLGRAARTPDVIDRGQIGDQDFLILEWIQTGRSRRNEQKLGEDLARVHRQKAPAFGFDVPGYAGELPQYNFRAKDWTAFYLNRMLLSQVKLAERLGRWSLSRQKRFDRFCDRFTQAYQGVHVSPSLLHGDLWAGNVMYAENGDPVLIDPTVFYGNREMDLAMSLLFGGFGNAFYRSYHTHYPLDSGWQERVPWYQLYYLLRHLNLFGEAYGGSVERALDS